ncbi:hypothetical protein KAR91_81030, partial [Candidatus Pacearchaeota archaeon]|nr:hypothetical protein [Candidatus Pacearchaeota archaeon]
EADVGRIKMGETVYFAKADYSRKPKLILRIYKGRVVLKTVNWSEGRNPKVVKIGISENGEHGKRVLNGNENDFFHTFQEALKYQSGRVTRETVSIITPEGIYNVEK